MYFYEKTLNIRRFQQITTGQASPQVLITLALTNSLWQTLLHLKSLTQANSSIQSETPDAFLLQILASFLWDALAKDTMQEHSSTPKLCFSWYLQETLKNFQEKSCGTASINHPSFIHFNSVTTAYTLRESCTNLLLDSSRNTVFFHTKRQTYKTNLRSTIF